MMFLASEIKLNISGWSSLTNTDSCIGKSENYTSFNSAQQVYACVPE